MNIAKAAYLGERGIPFPMIMDYAAVREWGFPVVLWADIREASVKEIDENIEAVARQLENDGLE